MAIEKIQAIRGMSDMLPEDAPLWHFFEKEASSLAKLYGYQHIRTPIVEQTRLFKRGIGEVTDIVEKEMYSFVDSLNGDELSLRPENTASVVRACIEHNLLMKDRSVFGTWARCSVTNAPREDVIVSSISSAWKPWVSKARIRMPNSC